MKRAINNLNGKRVLIIMAVCYLVFMFSEAMAVNVNSTFSKYVKDVEEEKNMLTKYAFACIAAESEVFPFMGTVITKKEVEEDGITRFHTISKNAEIFFRIDGTGEILTRGINERSNLISYMAKIVLLSFTRVSSAFIFLIVSFGWIIAIILKDIKGQPC